MVLYKYYFCDSISVILGTLPTPSHDLSGSNSVLFYTHPANATVKLNDTYNNYYNTIIVVKHGNCSEFGHFLVELSIGKTIESIPEDSLMPGHNQGNVKLNMTSMDCVSGHGIYIRQLNITFDNTLLKFNGNSTDTNKTEISIRFIYRYHKKPNNDAVDTSSSTAFINIKESDPSEGGSCGENKSTTTDSIEEGNSTTTTTTTSHVITNKERLRVVSSSLRLDIVTEFLLFCSLIVLSFSMV